MTFRFVNLPDNHCIVSARLMKRHAEVEFLSFRHSSELAGDRRVGEVRQSHSGASLKLVCGRGGHRRKEGRREMREARERRGQDR